MLHRITARIPESTRIVLLVDGGSINRPSPRFHAGPDSTLALIASLDFTLY